MFRNIMDTNVTKIKDNTIPALPELYKIETMVEAAHLQEVLDAIKKTAHTPSFWIVERS